MSDSLWPMDSIPPGSHFCGVLQPRIMEWVDTPFSRGSSWPRAWTWVSCTAGRFFTTWAIREAQVGGVTWISITELNWAKLHATWEDRNQVFARQYIISGNKQLCWKQTSKIFKKNSLHIIIRETAKVFLYFFFLNWGQKCLCYLRPNEESGMVSP